MKRALKLALSIVLLIVVLYVVIPRGPLNSLVREQTIAVLRDRGVRISVNQVAVSLSELSFAGVVVGPSRAPTQIRIEELVARPRYLALLGGRAESALYSSLYGGTLEGILGVPIGTERVTGDLRIQGVDVSRHSQIGGLGLTRGIIAVKLSHFDISPGRVVIPDLTASLSEGTKPSKSVIPPSLTGLPLDLPLPSFSDMEFSVSGSAEGKTLNLSSISLSSSLGSFSGEGTFDLFDRRALSLRLDGSLSEDGVAQLGAWAAVACGGATPRHGQRISLALSAQGALKCSLPL